MGYCETRGGWLAHIPDIASMEEFIIDLRDRQGVAVHLAAQILIGGIRRPTGWEWTGGRLDGSPISNVGGSCSWPKYCPFNFATFAGTGAETALSVIAFTTTSSWNDIADGNNAVRGYACEFAPSITPTGPSPSPSLTDTPSNPTMSQTFSRSASASISVSDSPGSESLSTSHSSSTTVSPGPTTTVSGLTPTTSPSVSLTGSDSPTEASASLTADTHSTSALETKTRSDQTGTISPAATNTFSDTGETHSQRSGTKTSVPTSSNHHVSSTRTRHRATPSNQQNTATRRATMSRLELSVSASCTNSLQTARAEFLNDTIYLDHILGISTSRPLGAETHLVLLLNGDRIDETTLAANSNSLASCVIFDASHPELRSYLHSSNVSAALLNSSAIRITFRALDANASRADPLFATFQDTWASVSIMSSCMVHRFPVPSINITVKGRAPEPIRRNAISPAVVSTAKQAEEIGEVIGAVGGGGLIGSQVARSSLVLSLAQCEPDFDVPLGFMQHPFQLSFTVSRYGYYGAASLLNHFVMLGVPLFHALIGYLYAKSKRLPPTEGFTYVRFPSISVLPLLYLAEPTCMASVVLIAYADEVGWQVWGVISLLITNGIIVYMFYHLRKTWAAEMIPGESPTKMKAKKKTAVTDDDDINARESIFQLRKRQLMAWFTYFIDGGVSWKDYPGHKGYCRRHRIMFMDYTGKWYWFICVEVALAAVLGILDGARLGAGKCNANVLILLLLLLAFFVATVVLRPYNAPFLLLFSIAATGIQLTGAICMTIALYGNDSSWQATAENMAVVGIYLVLGRAVFDIVPKLKQFIVMIIKACLRKQPKDLDHVDLTERLIEAVQEERVEDDVQPDHLPEPEDALDFMDPFEDAALFGEDLEEPKPVVDRTMTSFPEYEPDEALLGALPVLAGKNDSEEVNLLLEVNKDGAKKSKRKASPEEDMDGVDAARRRELLQSLQRGKPSATTVATGTTAAVVTPQNTPPPVDDEIDRILAGVDDAGGEEEAKSVLRRSAPMLGSQCLRLRFGGPQQASSETDDALLSELLTTEKSSSGGRSSAGDEFDSL